MEYHSEIKLDFSKSTSDMEEILQSEKQVFFFCFSTIPGNGLFGCYVLSSGTLAILPLKMPCWCLTDADPALLTMAL